MCLHSLTQQNAFDHSDPSQHVQRLHILGTAHVVLPHEVSQLADGSGLLPGQRLIAQKTSLKH